MPFLFEFFLNDTKIKNVEIGFTHSRKWEEALDEAKISLPFYDSEEPVSQYGLLKILVREVDNYTDMTLIKTETINMLVVSDTVKLTSQYGIWRHDIQAVEYTAKLDTYIMASLARTRDIENTNRAKFQMTDISIQLNGGSNGLKGNEINYNQFVWLPPVTIQENYYTNKDYVIPQVIEAYQAGDSIAGELFKYSRRPVVLRVIDNVTGITGIPQYLSNGDITLSFENAGSYYIEYGLDAEDFSTEILPGYLADQYYLIRFFVNVLDENQLTMWDVINSVRQNVSKGGGIESLYYFEDTRIFDIDATFEEYLKSVQVPQMYLEQATARQMLIFALSYINALPRLEYGEELDTLTLEQFNLNNGEFIEENTVTKSGSQNTNQIGTRSYSPLNQVLPNNMDEPTTYSPSQDGFQQVRAFDLQITDASFSIKLDKELYTPKEFTLLIPSVKFTNNEVLGFTIPTIYNLELPLIERLINIDEWRLKDVTDNFPTITTKTINDSDIGLRTDMVENLYWTLGSKAINLSDTYGQVINKTLFHNVIKVALNEYFTLNPPEPYTFTYDSGGANEAEVMVCNGTLITADIEFLEDDLAFKELRFNLSYLTIENLVIKNDKADKTQINFYSEMRQNQDESIINVVRSSRKNYGDLQRTGNKGFSFQKVHYSLDDVLEVGTRDVNNFTITAIERQFFGEYILADYFVTKYHNRESRNMLVDQTYRWRDNYAKTVLNRHEHYGDYVVLYPPTYNYAVDQQTKFHSMPEVIPKMFGLLLGNSVTDLQTRATVAMVRTDGMFEVEAESDTYHYGILAPVSSYPVKNGLAFTLGFDNNQVAGDGLVERDENWYNQAVRYTNLKGRFKRFGFDIMPKYELDSDDYETYPKVTKNGYNQLLADKDIYFSTGFYDINETSEDALVVDKDPLTNFNLTYQIGFSSFFMNQYILGQKFFDNNWLVNNPNDTEVNTYLYLYSNETEYGLFDDMFVKEGYDSETKLDSTKIILNTYTEKVTFVNIGDLEGVTGWAIGDEDGYLYLACNEALNGFKYKPQHFLLDVKEIGNKVIYYELTPGSGNELGITIDVNIVAEAHALFNRANAIIEVELNIEATGYKVNVYNSGDVDLNLGLDIYANGYVTKIFNVDAVVEHSVYTTVQAHISKEYSTNANVDINIDASAIGYIQKIFNEEANLVTNVETSAIGHIYNRVNAVLENAIEFTVVDHIHKGFNEVATIANNIEVTATGHIYNTIIGNGSLQNSINVIAVGHIYNTVNDTAILTNSVETVAIGHIYNTVNADAEVTHSINVLATTHIGTTHYGSAVEALNVSIDVVASKKQIYNEDIDISHNVAIEATGRRLIVYNADTELELSSGVEAVAYISPVEWVEVASGTVTGGNCTTISDIGNIKTGDGTCEYTQVGSTYSSATNESTVKDVCGEGTTYTSCVYDGNLGTWICKDYEGSIPTVKFICQLK